MYKEKNIPDKEQYQSLLHICSFISREPEIIFRLLACSLATVYWEKEIFAFGFWILKKMKILHNTFYRLKKKVK